MAEYPRARALLRQLLSLSPEDELLPLPILINVYRAQLRAPLLATLRLAVFTPGEDDAQMFVSELLEAELHERWPFLMYSKDLFEPAVKAGVPGNGWNRTETWDRIDEIPEAEPLHWLLYNGMDDWSPQEPLCTLYQMTWGEAYVDTGLQYLEAELGAHRDVESFILAMSALAAG
jgi:hypothetical protein